MDESLDDQTKQQVSRLRVLLDELAPHPDERFFPDVEISPREVSLLRAVGTRGEMIMTDLAAVIKAPLSTVTRRVDRLAAKGLVERSRSEEDRRVVVVKMGAKGKLLQASFRKHQQEIARRMLAPLTPGERGIFLELMAKVIRGLNDAPDPEVESASLSAAGRG